MTGGWEALRADPLPWLLDGWQPNLHWRVLTDLVGRPPGSPAVLRAKGGAGVAEPVAALLQDLHPDGSWECGGRWWTRYSGGGWRLLASVQWGADPDDPRLHAAAELLLNDAPGESGFSHRPGEPPSAPLTARIVQGLARLGWCRHPRVLEALAWLGEWNNDTAEHAAVTAVALLDALLICDSATRRSLRDRMAGAVVRELGRSTAHRLGHPNLLRTDHAEMLSTLARAGFPFDPHMTAPLRHLQAMADEAGRWKRGVAVPRSLRIPEAACPTQGLPSRWISLSAVVALMRYAGEAGLPRLFPSRPQ